MADIGRHGERPRAGVPANGGHRRFQILGAYIGAGHGHAFPRQIPRHELAETARGTGDQRHLALQLPAHVSS